MKSKTLLTLASMAVIFAGCQGTTAPDTTTKDVNYPIPPTPDPSEQNLSCCKDDINARFPKNDFGHYGYGVIFGKGKLVGYEWKVWAEDTNKTETFDFDGESGYFYNKARHFEDLGYGVSADGRTITVDVRFVISIVKFMPKARYDRSGTRLMDCYQVDGFGYDALMCPW